MESMSTSLKASQVVEKSSTYKPYSGKGSSHFKMPTRVIKREDIVPSSNGKK